ncbi:unnamed protein product, partial [marine sediment metagenome]
KRTSPTTEEKELGDGELYPDSWQIGAWWPPSPTFYK